MPSGESDIHPISKALSEETVLEPAAARVDQRTVARFGVARPLPDGRRQPFASGTPAARHVSSRSGPPQAENAAAAAAFTRAAS